MLGENTLRESIKISIVTVCYNAEKIIENTILSVLGQTYQNIEYILVDGKSEDRTLQIIKKYSGDRRIRYVSELDEGIYDAMNKGGCMATGDYIQFLNAGDLLVNAKVVEGVVAQIKEKRCDIVYGDIVYCYPDGSKSKRIYGQFCSSWFYYLLGDCINHQAIFARRECIQENCFDTSYKICADREWMLRVKKQHKRYKALGMTVCQYSLEENSASIKNREIYKEEARRCVKRYLKAGYPLFWMIDKVRGGKVSAQILHKAYTLIFMK